MTPMVSLRLDPRVRMACEREAERQGLSLSEWLRRVITEAVVRQGDVVGRVHD